ncbi:MAG: exonuclease domain-containing protein [Candidatus Merdivicinus sp.]|jgi:inhibitor of KinA sporulation pathway (predicted exonuclease)
MNTDDVEMRRTEAFFVYHIFLDFEMNPIAAANRKPEDPVRHEIIEIGAVKLDPDYQLIDRYDQFVHPELNTITKKITGLTGITQEDVEHAPILAKALEQFANWIGEGPVRVYSWSETDRSQLFGECDLKDLYIPDPFFRWMDFQRVYTRLVGLSRRSNLSLQNAMGAVEQTFTGRQHRAVDDAEMSASLLTLVKDPVAFAERTRIIQQVLKPASASGTGSTLGDLFAETFAKLKAENPQA